MEKKNPKKDKIGNLFRELFTAEKEGDQQKILEVKKQIQAAIENPEQVPKSEESQLREFFDKLENKPFMKILKPWILEGRPTEDLKVAKMMTSMLTHSIIEMEQEGEEVYYVLGIPSQLETIRLFLGGDISEDRARGVYAGRFAKYIRDDIEPTEKGS